MANSKDDISAKAKRQLMSKIYKLDIGDDEEFIENDDEYNICKEYNLIIVCPSHNKECGIGRYSGHVASASGPHYRSVTLLETTYQALKMVRKFDAPCIVIFQHEYSLVDFQYNLGEDDTTSSIILNLSLIQQINEFNRVALFMHSMHLLDHGLNRINKQIFSASFPIFHTNKDGCAKAQVNFTELGVPSFGVEQIPPLPQKFTVGAFGFLSPNKDVRSTLELCARAGVYLRANYAPNNTGSPQSILEAQRHVEAQIAEIGVTANVTFDFMTDDQLRSMITETSVIYAPQHDFSHYATSASVRFPLAVGRGAIVPPYRCFHDVAAGVQFAQLDEAIQIVRSMSIDQQGAEKLASMGLKYAQRSEIGKIYRSIGRRLINDEVWCGGNPDGFRLPDRGKDVELRVKELDGHDPWSIQNENGIKNAARGLRGGFFVYRSNVEGREELADIFEELSAEIDLSALNGNILECVRNIFDRRKYIHADLRSWMGGGSRFISVVEFTMLPSYLKFLVLNKVFLLSVDDAASIMNSVASDNTDDLLGDMLVSCDAMVEMAKQKKANLDLLTWGDSILANVDIFAEVIYPEYLLSLGTESFARGVYRTLLRRDPEPGAADNIRHLIASGMTKSAIVFSVANSPEGKKVGVKLASSLADWQHRESKIFSLVEMSKLIAPYDFLVKSKNLSLKDKIYANVS